MFEHLKGARLGLFVFFGTILFVMAVFLIGNKELLFKDSIKIISYFPTVEGLKEGSLVRYTGIDVGSVSKIEITGDSVNNVRVTMKINADTKRFIKKDAVSSIETEGLVGNKILMISGGSGYRLSIEDGDVLRSKIPTNFAQIIEETQGIMSYVKELTKQFSDVSRKINEGDGTIGLLINDNKLYKNLERATNTAENSLNAITQKLTDVTDGVKQIGGIITKVIINVDSLTSGFNDIIQKVNRGEGALGAITTDKSGYDSVKTMINNLVITSYQAKIASERFAENMEALKHNWLFKGYFEKRGYWDKEQYAKELEMKIEELNRLQKELDEKMTILKELEKKFGK